MSFKILTEEVTFQFFFCDREGGELQMGVQKRVFLINFLFFNNLYFFVPSSKYIEGVLCASQLAPPSVTAVLHNYSTISIPGNWHGTIYRAYSDVTSKYAFVRVRVCVCAILPCLLLPESIKLLDCPITTSLSCDW